MHAFNFPFSYSFSFLYVCITALKVDMSVMALMRIDSCSRTPNQACLSSIICKSLYIFVFYCRKEQPSWEFDTSFIVLTISTSVIVFLHPLLSPPAGEQVECSCTLTGECCWDQGPQLGLGPSWAPPVF